MKIALLISGQLRNFKSVHSFFKQNLLDIINPDIYLYTTVSDKPSKIRDEGSIEEYVELYKPKLYSCDTNNVYIWKNTKFNQSYISPLSIFNQSYKRLQCYKLIVNPKEYDIIIVTRPDIVIGEEFYVGVLDYAANNLLIPLGSDWEQGICDVFAIGPPYLISIYCNLYNRLYEYTSKNIYFHPETLLKHHLDEHNIPIKRFSLVTHLAQRRMT